MKNGINGCAEGIVDAFSGKPPKTLSEKKDEQPSSRVIPTTSAARLAS
jgi:hypothetical protein